MFFELTSDIRRTSQRRTNDTTNGSFNLEKSSLKLLSFITHITTLVKNAARIASIKALIGIKSHL